MVALSQNEWIKRAKNIHGNQYDYSRVKYVNQHTPIVVVCKTHGEFNVTPSNHVRKMQSENHTPNGCPSCGREKVIARNKAGRQTEEQALKRLVEVHGSLYQYCNYKSYMESIDICCPEHGWFNQKYYNHIRGTGCPKCKNSKGEKAIARLLESKGIAYIKQHRFDDCINPNTSYPLYFDFFLPEKKCCIEYDGEQHFKPVKFHKKMTDETAKSLFEECKQRDAVKTKYCQDNNLQLIRVGYKDLKNFEINA